MSCPSYCPIHVHVQYRYVMLSTMQLDMALVLCATLVSTLQARDCVVPRFLHSVWVHL